MGLTPFPEMFGFGKTVHTSIQKLHELYPAGPPKEDKVNQVVVDTFHLKHVPQSSDPQNRPGAYENARNRAVEITRNHGGIGSDFERERQVEAVFGIPAANCVISGSIDLCCGRIEVTYSGRKSSTSRPWRKSLKKDEKLDWTELALQVQLFVERLIRCGTECPYRQCSFPQGQPTCHGPDKSGSRHCI